MDFLEASLLLKTAEKMQEEEADPNDPERKERVYIRAYAELLRRTALMLPGKNSEMLLSALNRIRPYSLTSRMDRAGFIPGLLVLLDDGGGYDFLSIGEEPDKRYQDFPLLLSMAYYLEDFPDTPGVQALAGTPLIRIRKRIGEEDLLEEIRNDGILQKDLEYAISKYWHEGGEGDLRSNDLSLCLLEEIKRLARKADEKIGSMEDNVLVLFHLFREELFDLYGDAVYADCHLLAVRRPVEPLWQDEQGNMRRVGKKATEAILEACRKPLMKRGTSYMFREEKNTLRWFTCPTNWDGVEYYEDVWWNDQFDLEAVTAALILYMMSDGKEEKIGR